MGNGFVWARKKGNWPPQLSGRLAFGSRETNMLHLKYLVGLELHLKYSDIIRN